MSALIAIPAGWVLVQQAIPGAMTVGALTYAASLFLLLGTSGTYHTPTWTERPRATLRLIDHSMIFILIGGSYTPFLLATNDDGLSFALPLVWGIAIRIYTFLGERMFDIRTHAYQQDHASH